MSEHKSEQSNVVEFTELKFPPIEYGVTEATLAELAEQYKDPDASTEYGYEHCKNGCRTLTHLRSSIETRRLDLKRPVAEWIRTHIDNRGKDLIRRVRKIEGPVRAEKERVDEIKQAEARKVAEAEQERIDGFRDNIELIVATAREQNPNDTAADYQQHITWLKELTIDEEVFGEFVEEANTARDAALFKLTQWHDAALGREEADHRRAEQQAEIDRQKEELEAAQEKQLKAEEALAKKAREAELRKAAEEKAAHEKAEREQQEKDEAEGRRVSKIRDAIDIIATIPGRSFNMSSEQLSLLINDVRNNEPCEAIFQEFLAAANTVRTASLESLDAMMAEAKEREEKARREEEAKLPDKAKLVRWCDAIASIPEPEVLNDKAQKLLQRCALDLLKICDRLRADIAKL